MKKIDYIFKGAVFYYTKPRVSVQGELLPCSFPPGGTDWTPATSPCDTEAGYVSSEPADWATPEWELISVSFPGDLRHQFRYETSPDGGEIVVEARVDPECDGTWTVVQWAAVGNGVMGDCDLVSWGWELYTEAANE